MLQSDLPWGRITVQVDRADMPPEALFSFAARNNRKRSFLFLSHVLGKHLPVPPQVMGEVHRRLAAQIPALPGPVVFVGMAETATGLGQGVFEAWRRQHPKAEAVFLHTTRYQVEKGAPLCFEESHSHAPQQWLYMPADPLMRERFARAGALVLVDDEISTGATFVNLARACREMAPGVSHVHLTAITNFMGGFRSSQVEREIGGVVSVGAILEGQWRFDSNGVTPDVLGAAQSATSQSVKDTGWGRLGREACMELDPADVARVAKGLQPGAPVLVLGTGEFMHAAFVLARALEEQVSVQAFVQSTTRSPIARWGRIEEVLAFPDSYGEGVPNYLYNYQRDAFAQVFLCHETGHSPEVLQLAALLDARPLHFWSESRFEENPVC